MCVFKNHAFIYFLRPLSWSGTTTLMIHVLEWLTGFVPIRTVEQQFYSCQLFCSPGKHSNEIASLYQSSYRMRYWNVRWLGQLCQAEWLIRAGHHQKLPDREQLTMLDLYLLKIFTCTVLKLFHPAPWFLISLAMLHLKCITFLRFCSMQER
jgi:hypothetical protein